MTRPTLNSILEQGWKAYGGGNLEHARQLFQNALEGCSGYADLALRADIHVAIGKAERDLKHNEPAVSHYRSAAEIYRDTCDRMGLAHAIRHVADILRGMGRIEEAEPFIVEAIEIYRNQLQSSEPYTGQQPLELHLANGLRVAALLKEQAGLNADALPFWVEARDLYRLAGVDAGVAESRAHLAAAQAG
jgi:tetratricopeptide (TPR) repeat protein